MTDQPAKPDPGASAPQQAEGRPGRKLLLDLGPLVVFFAANYMTGDFMLAVKLLVGATLVALAPHGGVCLPQW